MGKVVFSIRLDDELAGRLRNVPSKEIVGTLSRMVERRSSEIPVYEKILLLRRRYDELRVQALTLDAEKGKAEQRLAGARNASEQQGFILQGRREAIVEDATLKAIGAKLKAVNEEMSIIEKRIQDLGAKL